MRKTATVVTKPTGKRARTRASLVEAASQLISEKGYDRLSMDKVAARAGMTKGAIYSNFASKEDLVMEAFLTSVKRAPPQLTPGGSLADQLQALAEDLIAQGPAVRGNATKLVAFHLYVLTHEDMRVRVVKENARIYERLEAWVRAMLPVDELPMSPAQFVRLLHALSNGLLITSALLPELVSADVVRATFAALAGDRRFAPKMRAHRVVPAPPRQTNRSRRHRG